MVQHYELPRRRAAPLRLRRVLAHEAHAVPAIEDVLDTRREQRIPADEAVKICKDVCNGLERAHELGILHRDLKPANIFLSTRDQTAKILARPDPAAAQ